MPVHHGRLLELVDETDFELLTLPDPQCRAGCRTLVTPNGRCPHVAATQRRGAGPRPQHAEAVVCRLRRMLGEAGGWQRQNGDAPARAGEEPAAADWFGAEAGDAIRGHLLRFSRSSSPMVLY